MVSGKHFQGGKADFKANQTSTLQAPPSGTELPRAKTHMERGFASTLCVFVYSWRTCSFRHSITSHESFIKEDESDVERNRWRGKTTLDPKAGGS